MRFSPLLAALVVSVAGAGCASPARSPRRLVAEPVSATMSMSSPHPSQQPQRLTYTLSLPAVKLETGRDSTITVTVANSTDATQSSRAYYRVKITDTSDKVWMDTYPPEQTGIIGPVMIAPRETYRYETPFLVPPEGVYVVEMPDVYEGHSSIRLAVAFESADKARSVDRGLDETIGPLALGQVAEVGPYEVVLKVVNSKWKPPQPPYMSTRHGPGPPRNLPQSRPARTAQLAAGVVVQNPKGSQEASLPIPTFETFTLIDGSGRSWEASGGVSLTTTGWHPNLDVSSGVGESMTTVLRPGEYFYMSPIFFVPSDADGLMLIYRPLVKSPSQAVEFVIGSALPAVPPSFPN